MHEYIVESVLDPQRFVVQGYPEHTMPTWYGSKLSALALEKIAAYLERQTAEVHPLPESPARLSFAEGRHVS